MKITFGLSLDGFRPSSAFFDHLYCGSLGLIANLELRLGLAHQSSGSATRLHQYLNALEAVAAGRKCFFANSLKADRWGTAAALLDMRDELRMAGWNEKDAPLPRLEEFVAVESALSGDFSPGLAERIEMILVALETNNPGITEVECRDRREFLPHQLGRLLEVLGAIFPSGQGPAEAPEGSNLRLIQEFLGGKLPKDASWNPTDDSVVFVTAFSEVTLAQVAARWMPEDNPPTLLATVPAQALADVLRGCQKAAPALDTRSPLRPIAQVLGLALEMRWSPPDPSLLLQFLTHPVSPIERGLRAVLADAVADQPGIGSKRWQEGIRGYEERLADSATLTEEEKSKKLSRIQADLEQWLLSPRFSREDGAPGLEMAKTARQVEAWARMRAGLSAEKPESRHFLHLASQAAEFAAIAESIPALRPEELSHILEQICAAAPAAGDRFDELGACDTFTDAAAFIEPRDVIFWWGFENQETRFAKRWSARESEALRQAGIHLPTAESHLARFHEASARPFLAARKQIVLFWPKSRGGDPVARHPLCTLLEATLGHLPVVDLDQDVPEFPSCLSLQKTARPVRTLPEKRRWIQLANSSALSPRDEESFSSISKFALRPFEWVFHYAARLRRGRLREINPFIQRGNLLHHVVERLLEPGCKLQWKKASKAEFDDWLDEIWKELLESEGANLLQPGWRTDGQRLLEDARRSIWILISHMKSAGVDSAIADVLAGPVPLDSANGPQIRGFIDLLVTNSKGHAAVVDLKFAQGKAKRTELSTNTALQLAVYARLMQAKSKEWPDMAYFILRSGSLLTQTDSFFPNTEKILPKSGEIGPEAIWDSFLEVWRWRCDQLQAGWIEFPLEGTLPTDGSSGPPSSSPPREEWTPDPAARRYDDFQFLTGWEAAK